MALQLISKRRPLSNRSVLTFFSTAADADDGDDGDRSRSSIDSYFSDVKSSLGQQQQQQSLNDRPRRPPATVSLDEIRSKLSLFPRRDAGSPQQSPGGSAPTGNGAGSGSAGRISFDLFRTNRSSNPQSLEEEKQPFRLTELRNALGLRPGMVPKAPEIGGVEDELPSEVFGKEIREREEGAGGGRGARRSRATMTDFLRSYNAEDLGNKLRKLRPRGKKEPGWFSVEELSGRLMKLREEEEKESDSSSAIHGVGVLRSCLQSLDEVNKKGKETSVGILDIISRSQSFTTLPPKEHLLELYNHPDNMSASEKMKIELTKVREEFKMTESDCGSTRVQVALLTTKIKYLSSTLHKKDKHSRKGLVEMVHKRKRLLKYLRRTDWDSYCLVLDKLGLRDTPDHKLAHKH